MISYRYETWTPIGPLMILIPLGLEARSKNIPWATLLITVMTVTYSIYMFNQLADFETDFWNAPERKSFSIELKKHLLQKCTDQNRGDVCSKLKSIPANLFAAFDRLNIDKKKPGKLFTKEVIEFISSYGSKKALSATAHPLHAQYKLSEETLLNLKKKQNLLSWESLSPVSLFHAQWLHAGYMHLLGNMLILIFLGFPVEERLGTGLFALTYFVTGMGGCVFQLFMSPQINQLLGASGAIYGVAGALMVFYWRQNARILASLFFAINRVVVLPVYIFAPVTFFAGDFAQTLEGGSRVAHLAHIGGFLIGAAIAFVVNRIDPLPAYFTFPFEMDFFKQVKAAKNDRQKLKLLIEWLNLTPKNLFAVKAASTVLSRMEKSPEDQDILEHYHKVTIPHIMKNNYHRKSFYEFINFVDLSQSPQGMDTRSLAKAAEGLIEDSQNESALKATYLLVKELELKNDKWNKKLADLVNQPELKSELWEQDPIIQQILAKGRQNEQSA